MPSGIRLLKTGRCIYGGLFFYGPEKAVGDTAAPYFSAFSASKSLLRRL
jgi:hypothetical protein